MKINYLLCVFLWATVVALDNGLARTPPMGWMSWLRYKCITRCDIHPEECISDRLIRKVADIMSSEGYLQAGYEYIIIDDCWMTQRNPLTNRLEPDPYRFPYGMKSLAEYIHSKGLKFGLYECLGNYTCAGFPGMKNNLELDAKTFAEWEIDYIKVDGCGMTLSQYSDDYINFGKYLNATSRPIIYSCSWPFYLEKRNIIPDYFKVAETCNLWRNWDDIEDSYWSMINIIDWYEKRQEKLIDFIKPGSWNDLDMVIIGNFGLNVEQSKLQLALWAILSAPMLMSVDLGALKLEYKKILLNKEVIAINQDKLGVPGMLFGRIEEVDVWIKPVEPIVEGEQSFAVAFQDKRKHYKQYSLNVSSENINLISHCGYIVRNIFEFPPGQKLLKVGESLNLPIPLMGVVLLKFTPACDQSALKE